MKLLKTWKKKKNLFGAYINMFLNLLFFYNEEEWKFSHQKRIVWRIIYAPNGTWKYTRINVNNCRFIYIYIVSKNVEKYVSLQNG